MQGLAIILGVDGDRGDAHVGRRVPQAHGAFDVVGLAGGRVADGARHVLGAQGGGDEQERRQQVRVEQEQAQDDDDERVARTLRPRRPKDGGGERERQELLERHVAVRLRVHDGPVVEGQEPEQGRALDGMRDRVLAACKKHGKVCAMLVNSFEQMEQWRNAGALLLAYSSDADILYSGYAAAMKRIKGGA